jgi:hypothetical protein
MDSDRWYLSVVDYGVLQDIVDLDRILGQLTQIAPKGRHRFPAPCDDLSRALFT